MPRSAPRKTGFDPSLCPLLIGLPPEEQEIRMQTDPVIRRCIGQMSATPGDQRLVCRSIGREEQTHLDRRKKSGANVRSTEPATE